MLLHLEICARCSFCLGQPTSRRRTLLAWPVFVCPLTLTHLITIFIHDRTQYNLTIPGQGGLSTNICCLKDILRKRAYILQASRAALDLEEDMEMR